MQIPLFFIFIVLSLTGCGEPIGEGIPRDVIDDNDDFVYLDQECSKCDFVIATEEFLFDGVENNVQPGDTICFQGGQRGGVGLRNIHGNEENPVVIINCEGLVELFEEGSHGMRVTQSSYFHITGLGATEHKYGFNLATTNPGGNSLVIEKRSTNFEVDHVEVSQGGYAGMVCRSDATCDGSISRSNFTQFNTRIHHNYIHNTSGEGMYVGGSHWASGFAFANDCFGTTLFEPELVGVRIYSNLVEDTGRDAIQVGSAVEDCKIYDNIVRNYALNRDEGHLSGYQINGGTTGEFYRNIAIGGFGYGVFLLGRGDNTLYSNIIIRPLRDGIITGDRNPTPGAGFYIINNTIISPGDKGFTIFSNETEGTVYYNNIVTNPGLTFFSIETNDVTLDTSNNILTNNVEALMFVDAANNDFRLQEGSIAIDAGLDVSSYGVDTDFLGNPRPVGEYDVGAIEKQE
ncbi:MAG: right-handed parallel beta-helix repeat-containing protein [Fulvivirga sp.]|nr:right-handed parallel beta-helix repeat-containing protein [Fulvivirga sp.]